MFFCCSNYADYRNQWLDLASTQQIKEFVQFCDSGDGCLPETTVPFAIQAVEKKNFGPTLSIVWYVRKGKGFQLDPTNNAAGTFKRSNDFKNFKCKTHQKFFEVNLYDQSGISHHHESTRSGRQYDRDASIDQVGGSNATKGAHWTHPAKST